MAPVEKMPDISMKSEWGPQNKPDLDSWYPSAELGQEYNPPPRYAPVSPDYPPPGYNPSSPDYPPPGYNPSSPAYNSPGYAPPDFNDRILRDLWTKLTNEEQNLILALPDEQQEEATKNLIINRPQAPFQIPNYGSDGELNHIFSGLPRLEQIELLKLSHERQIEKLVKLAKNEKSDSNDFSKLRIIIPENKTSSEELYGSPELQMLAPAPANTPVTEEKTPEDKKDISGGSTNNNNIKKIIF